MAPIAEPASPTVAPAAGDWRLGFRSLEVEHAEPVPLDIAGTLPDALAGTLYRIGPARHEVYGSRYRHWFDGDGMVHAVTLSGGAATYRNRFVETRKKAEEDAARRRLHAGFGTPPAGGPIARVRRFRPPNAANINVVSHAGVLMALWEQGRPIALDPATLETIGETTLGGALVGDDTFSAHPRVHPRTGDLWNFGVVYGKGAEVNVFRSTPRGQTTKMATAKLPFPAMVHDFALTDRHAVLLVPPLMLPEVPLAMILGRRSYGESLRWRPRRLAHVGLLDLETLTWRWSATEPFFVFHLVNAFDAGEEVVVDACLYENDRVMQAFVAWMRGEPLTEMPLPERLVITPDGAVRRRRLCTTPLEFPRVRDGEGGAEQTVIVGVSMNVAAEFIGAPVTVRADGRAAVHAMAAHELAGECVPVPKDPARPGAASWLLTMVLDAAERSSSIWVLDEEDVQAPPVARVRLPHAVPFGLHGSWVPIG